LRISLQVSVFSKIILVKIFFILKVQSCIRFIIVLFPADVKMLTQTLALFLHLVVLFLG
jgi:hypothetical protein